MKRILVALDSSSRAELVLAGAAKLAGLVGATLVLFRAISLPSGLPSEAWMTTDVRLEELLQRNAREALERMASTLPAGLVTEIVTELATAWDGILRAGRSHEVDLIVIGSHGLRGIDHLLGTTAAKVVNRADRNVLVIRTQV